MLREAELSQAVNNCVLEISKASLGKGYQIRLALSCLLSGGHLLITDWGLRLGFEQEEGPVDFHDRVVKPPPELSGLMSQLMDIYISARVIV